jgi:hypothetical protein
MKLGISEAVELTKTIGDLVRKGITIDLQERISDLREAVLNAKEEVQDLRHKNHDLREELAAREDWRDRSSAYKWVKTDGGATVLYTADKPARFVCPACFEKRAIHPLQDPHSNSGQFVCTACDKHYPVRRAYGFASTPPPVRIIEAETGLDVGTP